MAIFRVTDFQIMWSQSVQNRLHFRADAGGPIVLNDLADHFIAHWIGNIRGMQLASIVHVAVKVEEIGAITQPLTKTINLVGTQGALDHTLLPITAEVIKLRGLNRGRHGLGRVYIAGCPNGGFFDGIMNSTRITAWQPKLADLALNYLPGATTPYRLVIAQKNSPATTMDVSTLSMATLPGVQKRRNVGHGI